MIVAPTATFSEVMTDFRMTGLSTRLRYQSVPKPPQLSNARPLLKE